MCGLVGAVGNLHNADKNKFSTLFLVNVLRGGHGCGIFQLYEEKNERYFNWTKTMEPSSSWVWTEEYDSFISGPGTKLLMAHSRHATVGEKKQDNCHPFEHRTKKGNHITIGFHNGTIRGNFEGSKDYETDSEALFRLIHDRGLKDALDEVHKKCFNVAYALQYYDNKKGEVYLIRNKERPLYMLKVKGLEEYFWASEAGMLRFTFNRSGTEFDWIKEVPVNSLVTLRPWEAAKDRIKLQENWYSPPAYESSFQSSKKEYNYGAGSAYQGYPYDDSSMWDEYQKRQEKQLSGKFIEIGKIAVPFSAYKDTLQSGCCVCSFPDIIYPATTKLKQYFIPGSITDFVCNDCATDKILGEYGMKIDDLVQPKFV